MNRCQQEYAITKFAGFAGYMLDLDRGKNVWNDPNLRRPVRR